MGVGGQQEQSDPFRVEKGGGSLTNQPSPEGSYNPSQDEFSPGAVQDDAGANDVLTTLLTRSEQQPIDTTGSSKDVVPEEGQLSPDDPPWIVTGKLVL